MLIPKFLIFHGKLDVLLISSHLQMFGGFLKWGVPGTLRINLNRCFHSKTIQLLGYHGVPLWKATFLDVFQLVTMFFPRFCWLRRRPVRPVPAVAQTGMWRNCCRVRSARLRRWSLGGKFQWKFDENFHGKSIGIPWKINWKFLEKMDAIVTYSYCTPWSDGIMVILMVIWNGIWMECLDGSQLYPESVVKDGKLASIK